MSANTSQPNVTGPMRPVIEGGEIKGFQNINNATGEPDTSRTFTREEVTQAHQQATQTQQTQQ